MTSAYFLEGRNPYHGDHSCGKEFASTVALGRMFCFPKANLVIGKRMCTYLVLVNHLGLSLPRNSAIRSVDRPNVTIAVYRGRKATTQQQKSTGANSLLYESTHMTKYSKNDRVACFQSVSFQLMLR